MELSELDRRLIVAAQDGLPLVPRPYAAVAETAGCTEDDAIAGIARLMECGIIKRLGIVVRHHELGYRANAMTVWDVPDDAVDEIGRRMSDFADVTLCYRRPRRPPVWRYNLFAMVHGRDRAVVAALVERMAESLGLTDVAREVLFSRRRFKQRGARYG